jgi:hypothetical protein
MNKLCGKNAISFEITKCLENGFVAEIRAFVSCILEAAHSHSHCDRCDPFFG